MSYHVTIIVFYNLKLLLYLKESCPLNMHIKDFLDKGMFKYSDEWEGGGGKSRR